MIAMALACEPKILIADEPTTALDVTIQAQVLGLIRELRGRLNTAILLITHDLGVIAENADRVIVMYAGKKIEEAPVIVQSTLSMGYAVLVEATLGFIGVGVRPPTPTWGNMLYDAFPMLEQQPMLSIFPGLAIFLLVLSFNFVGDTLRDVLDPRLKGITH